MQFLSIYLFTTFLSLTTGLVGTSTSAMHSLVVHQVAATSADETVWICTSKRAYAYHNSADCSRIRQCGSPLAALSRNQAVMRYTPCGTCKPR